MTAEDDDDYHTDLLDDLRSYSEEQLPISCPVCGEDQQQIYRPTTSRQADEEDQHVELFHKNLLAFAPSSSYEQETDTIPSCSYDYNDEERSSSGGDGGGAAANTGFTQSDLTGSSSSTLKNTRTEYGYSNQCEYVSCEFPQRKRSYSLKLLSSEKKEMLMSNCAAYVRAAAADENTARDSPSEGAEEPKLPENSVLQVTDCSSPEFSEPSK